MQWVFFDCFNTLVDDFDPQGAIDGLETVAHIPVEAGLFATSSAFRRAFNAARAENWWQTDSEVHLPIRLREVYRRTGRLDPQACDQLVAITVAAFNTAYPTTLRATDGVESMLQAWSGVARLAVVSNFFMPDWPQRVLQQFSLAGYFQFVVNSAEVGAKKPEPEIYAVALQQAGVTADQVLFVGDDHERDVVTPRSLGMQARHVCRHGLRPGVAPSPELNAIRHWDEFRPASLLGTDSN